MAELKGLRLQPPAADKCEKCAVAHEAHLPHDQTSLYWQYWFYGKYGRWPTWHDAMRHCDPELRSDWIRILESDFGIEVGPEPMEAKKG